MVARDGASAVQPTDAPQAGHFDEGTDSANYVKLIGIESRFPPSAITIA